MSFLDKQKYFNSLKYIQLLFNVSFEEENL